MLGSSGGAAVVVVEVVANVVLVAMVVVSREVLCRFTLSGKPVSFQLPL